MDSSSPVQLQVHFASSSAAVQSASAKACPSLSPSVWGKLPDELLEIVLTKLPISALKRFSRLSKRWRAFIRSEEFAHRCHSSQLTAVYFDPYANNWLMPHLYTAIPSPKSRSWKKHFLDFINVDELVCNPFAADQGLLCYRVRKKGTMVDSIQFEEIVLVVLNLFTGKWKRLVVPFTPHTDAEMMSVMCENNLLVGLCVDKETGSYKLVVAFVDSELSRKTFVYNSLSTSWTISAAVSPGLERLVDFSMWDIQQSICCAGEVYWLVQESEIGLNRDYPHFKTLIKYSTKLDTWSVATQQRPCETACHLHLVCFENLLMLVNFDDVSEKSVLFPEEFFSLFPGLVKFRAETFRDVMNKAVYIQDDEDYLGHSNFLPRTAAAEGSALFIHSECKDNPDINNLEVIFGFNGKSPKVARLPFLDLEDWMMPLLLTSTLKSFL